ncbi:MAG: DNA cytosine methyltransferase, partial [Candidatus Nanopelagicaceae bacterium]
LKVAEIIKVKNPRYLAVENVRAYQYSDSFKILLKAIDDSGYNFDWNVYDAANFGVPQNRDRLIVRASRDRLPILETTHSKTPGFFHKPWNGWYDAIKHILASCKDTHLTKNQMKSLENKGWENIEENLLVEGKDSPSRDRTVRKEQDPCMTITVNQGGGGRLPKAVLVCPKGNNNGSSHTTRKDTDPSFTVTANMDRHSIRAVMVARTGYDCDRGPAVRECDRPSPTIRSSVGCDGKGGFRSPLTVVKNAQVFALDYRCLAALQSFPDSYKWGPKAGANCRAIGNAVSPLFAEAIIRSIVHV